MGQLVGPCGSAARLAAAAPLATAASRAAAATSFTLYPNPATDQLRLETTADLAGSRVDVLNALGQLVLTGPGASGRVNVAGRPAGLYTLRLTVAGQVPVTGRFVK